MRREDQDKINRFSRLHQRELVLEGELKAMTVGDWWTSSDVKSRSLTSRHLQKERDELEDVTTELELADEDELVR